MAAIRKTVMIHIPLYNEEGNLPEVFRRVELIADAEVAYDWSFLLVDNCSTDAGGALCEAKAKADRRYQYVRMSRNWEANAGLVSFDYCDADAMIVLFSDLQDPPENIPFMLRKWEEGFHLVNGIVKARHDYTWTKTLGAWIAYKLIDTLADTKMPKGATDFRLMDRRVVEAVRQCREFPRFTRALVNWVGFRQTTFPYDRVPRVKGVSKAGLVHSVNLAFDAIMNFSDRPLRMISAFGMAVLFAALGLAGFYAAGILMGYPAPRGITTVFILILANMGITSFFLGVIGEYLGRSFVQSKRRPLYFVETALNAVPVRDSRSFP